uniref:C2H2-type domain-containing protein n=1 Tax=Megaselia scalaris TaxID=36166 RepID=T1GIN4_MEGSC
MAPTTQCCVCNQNASGMIQIKNHPNKLDSLLNFISGHQAQEDDFLCIVCYEELKQACDFKKKCMESPHYRPEQVIPKDEPIDNEVANSNCDSSIISLKDFFGPNQILESQGEDDDDDVGEPQIETEVINVSSEDDNEEEDIDTQETANTSTEKDSERNADKNIDLFFSTSDKICEFCFKSFDSKHGVDIHKKIHKFEEKPYTCPYKQSHITNYKCSYCNKTYKSKLLMENHEKSHEKSLEEGSSQSGTTNDSTRKSSKRYDCKVCGRGFTAKANLVFHVKYQHDKNWRVKDFECILCTEVFQKSEKLTAHLKKVHKCL